MQLLYPLEEPHMNAKSLISEGITYVSEFEDLFTRYIKKSAFTYF